MRFAGLFPTEVHMTGRNLDLLHVYLGTFRIAWLRELPTQGDFADKQAPVIRRVSSSRRSVREAGQCEPQGGQVSCEGSPLPGTAPRLPLKRGTERG